jgi:small-conductance mechanosensitive channel
MKEFWREELFHIGKLSINPAKILGMIVLLLFTWILLKSIKQLLLRNKKLTIGEKGRRISVFQLIRYFTWSIVISLSITLLGIDITLLVAGSAALLVGIGFGLQNIFSDLVSGLFMLFERRVKVGDIMEVDTIVGKVLAINLRTSVLLTRDGYNIIVPNHKFITENVINWSHNSYDRRFHLEVGVSYSSDVQLVTRLLLSSAESQKELITDEKHKPFVRFQDFGESGIIFNLMFWTYDIFRVEQVKSDLRYKIFQAFKDNNITIPFPQRDVHIIQP